MMNNQKFQNSDKKTIEIRFENDEVVIQATKEGLHKIKEFCDKLLKKPKIGHIHMEDYEVLTVSSVKATLVLLDS